MAAISVSSLIGKKKVPILTFLCQQITSKRLHSFCMSVCVKICVRGNATRLMVEKKKSRLPNLHFLLLIKGKLFSIMSLLQQPCYICSQFLTSVLFSFRVLRAARGYGKTGCTDVAQQMCNRQDNPMPFCSLTLLCSRSCSFYRVKGANEPMKQYGKGAGKGNRKGVDVRKERREGNDMKSVNRG